MIQNKPRRSIMSPGPIYQLLVRMGITKLLRYSLIFFVVKGLLWTVLLVYPLLKGVELL